MPVLSARCVGCHSAGQKIGNLNLEQFRDSSRAVAQPEIWKKVRDRIAAGTMPPPPAAHHPQPTGGSHRLDRQAARPCGGRWIRQGDGTAPESNRI